MLDFSSDRYFNFSYDDSQAFRKLIGWPYQDDISPEVLATVEARLDGKCLFAPEKFCEPTTLTSGQDVTGLLPFNDWLALADDVSYASRPLDVLRAIYWLHRAQRVTRLFRMRGAIESVLQAQAAKGIRYGTPEDYRPYFAAMYRAALIYPQCSPCLPWHTALATWCAMDGLHLRLAIGVQRQPFTAHAWTENRERVIGDDERRRSQLAVIFETPA